MNNYYQIREVDDDGYCRRLSPTGIIDLLNEQQTEITELKEENDQLKSYKLYSDNKRLQTIIADLKKENEYLRKELK